MTVQIEMDFSAPKSFRFSLQDYRIGAIYLFGSRRGLERQEVVSLLVDRARFKHEAADKLVGHWLTSEPYRKKRLSLTMTKSNLPEIKIMKAVCASFPGGYCYCANHPYYSGHYPTREKAAVAAVKSKREMMVKKLRKR